jgi:hypothetical protein
MDRATFYFFSKELTEHKKEAMLTPKSALNWMQSTNPIKKELGLLGAKMQGTAPAMHELANSVNSGLQTIGPAFALATAKGTVAREALKASGVSKKLSDLATYEEINSPFAKSINPLTPIIDNAGNKVIEYGYRLFG